MTDIEDESLLAVPRKRKREATESHASDALQLFCHHEHSFRTSLLTMTRTEDALPKRIEKESEPKEVEVGSMQNTGSCRSSKLTCKLAAQQKDAELRPQQSRVRIKKDIKGAVPALGKKKRKTEIKLLADERQIFKGLRFCKAMRPFEKSVLTAS